MEFGTRGLIPGEDVQRVHEHEQISTCGLIPGEDVQHERDVRVSRHRIGESSSVWRYLEERVRESVPQAELLSVDRICNPRLWTLFQSERDMVGRDNDGDPKCRLLFHGATRRVIEKICGLSLGCLEDGFFTNLGGNGQYSAKGCGIYFAEHAAYPVSIHPKSHTDNVYEVIVAEVILGKVKDYGKLCQPGLKSARSECGGRYHSVSGTEDSIGIKKVRDGKEEFGRQHITFHNSRAYPHFVISLRRGFRITNYASGRSLYATKQDNWTGGFGAGGESEVGPDGDWEIVPIGVPGVFRIVNVESGRCLFARANENWKTWVGAGFPKEEVGEDGNWKLIKTGIYWRIVNVASGRCLYASAGKNWEDGRGAGQPAEKVGVDGQWIFSGCILQDWFD